MLKITSTTTQIEKKRKRIKLFRLFLKYGYVMFCDMKHLKLTNKYFLCAKVLVACEGKNCNDCKCEGSSPSVKQRSKFRGLDKSHARAAGVRTKAARSRIAGRRTAGRCELRSRITQSCIFTPRYHHTQRKY